MLMIIMLGCILVSVRCRLGLLWCFCCVKVWVVVVSVWWVLCLVKFLSVSCVVCVLF